MPLNPFPHAPRGLGAHHLRAPRPGVHAAMVASLIAFAANVDLERLEDRLLRLPAMRRELFLKRVQFLRAAGLTLLDGGSWVKRLLCVYDLGIWPSIEPSSLPLSWGPSFLATGRLSLLSGMTSEASVLATSRNGVTNRPANV
jgi:hypothetical protein